MENTYKHPKVKGAAIYKQKQSKNFYMSFYDQNNERVQKSTKTSNYDEAIKCLEKQLMIIEAVKSGEFIIQKNKSNKKEIATICEILIKQIKEINGYQNLKPTILFLNKVKNKLGKIEIDELRRSDISIISTEFLSATAINNYKKVLNMILEYALDNKLVNYKINLGKFNKKEKEKRESTDLNKHKLIINEILKESENAKKQVSKENLYLLSRFIWFLRITGVRKGEAIYAKLEDFTEDNINTEKDKPNKIYFNIKHSKTRKRKILIPHEAFDIIHEIIIYYAQYFNYIKTKEKEVFIFKRSDGVIPNFTDRMKDFKGRNKDFFKSIEEEDYCIYKERHSFICEAIKNNIRIDDLAEHCGTSYDIIQNYYRDELATRNIETIYNINKYEESEFNK